MLYEGETLEEVFSKAFGKPIGKYGKKPPGFSKPGGKKPRGKKPGSHDKYRGKPAGFGKQGEEENRHGTPQAIARARQRAIPLARSFINSADETARKEDGFMVVYDTLTGVPDPRQGPRAGHASFGEFEFDFPRASRYALLVTAHTHVKSRTSDARTRRREDALNEDWSAKDKRNLLPFAPAFLKTPSGNILEELDGPFRPISEHPQR